MIRFKFIEKIPAIFRNRYLLTIVIFLIWLLFLDSNNLIARFEEMRDLNKLKTDREYYIQHIAADRQKLHELKTDNHDLEKFAREQYHMKRSDEDLYIVLTPRERQEDHKKEQVGDYHITCPEDLRTKLFFHLSEMQEEIKRFP